MRKLGGARQFNRARSEHTHSYQPSGASHVHLLVVTHSTVTDTSTASPRLAAVLWDMDGTLIDSEIIWSWAQSQLLEEFGLPPMSPEQEEQFVGVSIEIGAVRFQELGVPLTIEEIVTGVTNRVAERVRTGVEWRPGVSALLAGLHADRVPLAVVTNSSRNIVDAMLSHLPSHNFRALITSEEVTNPKPHPEPFLTAAQRLGVAANHCVAIEDSPTGVASAVAAGCAVIAVPHGANVAASDTFDRRSTLVDVDVPYLHGLVRRFAKEDDQ